MQFVAPAQIFLVLWLLAATAPAATALVNGSWSALIDAQSKDLHLPPPVREDADDATDSDGFALIEGSRAANLTTLLFLALSEGDCPPPALIAEDIISHGSEAQRIALPHSLLHTAVQRHRPRGA